VRKFKIILGIISLIFPYLFLGDVHAVPTLQLYSEDSFYNTTTESWMTYTNPFVLQVLGADQPNSLLNIYDVRLHIAVPSQYFVSGGSVTIEGITPSLESGSFGSLTFNASNFVQGIPPELAGWSGNARSHGIYNDAYYVSISLEDLQVDKTPSDIIINYVDAVEGIVPPGNDTGDIDLYKIIYSDFFLIHMDLTGTAYGYKKKGKGGEYFYKNEFAPFSHDADTDGVIPEPSSFILLGAGLVGLVLLRKRFKK
jgi:hypothetical protein